MLVSSGIFLGIMPIAGHVAPSMALPNLDSGGMAGDGGPSRRAEPPRTLVPSGFDAFTYS